jgi:hypothetical protein
VLNGKKYMKMTVFCVVAPCSLVVYRRFRGVCCLNHPTHHPVDGGTSTSKTLINFYQNTRRNNPEDSHLRTVNSFILRMSVENVSEIALYSLTVNCPVHGHGRTVSIT